MNTLATDKSRLLKGSKTYYINCIICIALMFGLRLVPPFAQITHEGIAILGAFIGCIYGWLTVGLLWPSIACMIALGTSGYMTVNDAMATGFAANNTISVIIFFGLLGVMESAGLTEWIALKIVHAKVGRNRPWMLTFLFMLATYVIVAATCSWQTLLIVWSVFYRVAEANKIEKGAYTQFAIASVPVAAIVAGQIIPYAPQCLLVTSSFTGAGGQALEFVPYFVWMFVVSMIVMVLWIVVGRFVLRIKPPAMDLSDIPEAKNLNKFQKSILALIVLYFIALVAMSVLPVSWAFTALLKNLGAKGLGAVVLLVTVLLNFTDGKSFNEIMRSVNWEVIFVVALINTLSNVLTAEDLGIMPSITGALTPIMTSIGTVGFVLLITIIPLILTQFFSNLVCGVLFVTISVSICNAMGLAAGMSTTLYMAILFLTSCGLATPAGCAVCVVYYGNKEWLSMKNATKYGILLAILGWIVTMAVGMPLGLAMF